MTAETTPAKEPKTGEATGSQQGRGGDLISSMAQIPGLSRPLAPTIATYRQMRSHPTIALARAVVSGPIVSSEWSYDSEDDAPEAWVDFIREQIDPMRRMLVNNHLRAVLDYGYQPYEKVFELRKPQSMAGPSRWMIRRCKPLLHDITSVLINKETGRFEGFKQGDTTVPLEKSLLYSHDGEAGNYYGRPRMENARKAWSNWNDANEAAGRYDNKISGVILVLHYPTGSSLDQNGNKTDNSELAKLVLNKLGGGNAVAVPNEYSAATAARDMGKTEFKSWQLDIIEDSGNRQSGFVERLSYLDKQMMRAFHRPERAALEGTHGTLAEAGAHGDIGLTDGDELHQEIAENINWHLVDQLLVLNFGEDARGAVFIKPAPIVDQLKQIAIKIIENFSAAPDGREDLKLLLELDQIMDLAGLPRSESNMDDLREQDDDKPPTDPTVGVPGDGLDADRQKKMQEEIDARRQARGSGQKARR